MKTLAAALIIALLAAPAGAQITATVNDTRVITTQDGGKPDTLMTHTISAGEKTRIEHTGFLPGTAAAKLSSSVEIINMHDTDMVMIYIDTTRKVYAEMHPMGMMSAAMQMSGMKMLDTTYTPTVDSIGPGPVIDGHPTLHFRTKTSSRMSMVMMGDSSVTTQTATADLFFAPDIKEIETDSAEKKNASRWTKMLPPGMVHLAEGAGVVKKRLGKYGTPLRTEMETVRTTAAGTSTTHQTIDVLRHASVVVPASTFLAPPGYKKVGLMDLMQMPN